MGHYEAIQNLHEERRTFALRVAVAGVICVLMAAALSIRLVDLQIVEHGYYTTRSNSNRVRLLPVAPVRGLIYDREGGILAQNVPAFQLMVTPEQVDDLDDALSRLGKLVHLSATDLQHFRERVHKSPHYRPVMLRNNLSDEEIARYELNRFDFSGVDVTAGLTRNYPLGESAAHVVGYVSGISEADYATIDEADYQGLDQIGKLGIERSHEDDLRGTPGSQMVEANASGRPLRELSHEAGVAGRNLYLTIDSRLQTIAEQALGNLDGAVVAIDPRNGEVLALVSKPGFDPKLFVGGIDTASYDALLYDPDKPLYNRALLNGYPPGSTIKPFMAAATLAYNALSPTTRVYCTGTFLLPNVSHKYRCWKRHGHGPLDLEEAIAHSCDVYFYTAAQALGIDHIDEMLAQFGFGTATGIDMPSEKNGLLPSKEWKRRVKHQSWYPGETIITGIGQGYWQVTPMQLAQAVSRIAMRGGGFKPHLVHAIEDPATHEVTAIEPEPLKPISGLTPAMMNIVIAGMQQVIQPGGTANATFHDASYTAAGKTGSAQVAGLSQEDEDAPKGENLPLKLRDHALFIAFAPVDQPRIAIAVIAEHGIHPNWSAAPVARQIMDQWLTGKVSYRPTSANAPPGAALPPPPPPEAPATEDSDAPDNSDGADDTDHPLVPPSTSAPDPADAVPPQ